MYNLGDENYTTSGHIYAHYCYNYLRLFLLFLYYS